MSNYYEGVDFKKVMSDYHSGDPTLKGSAVETMLKALKGFVFFIMQRYYPSYIASECNDMMQSAYLSIIKSMEDYNPELSRPTTYFAVHIKHGIQMHINKQTNPSSIYYQTVNKKIKEVDPNNVLDNEEVSKLCGFSVKTVAAARSVSAAAYKISIDEKPNEESSYYLPEKSIIEQTENNAFYNYIDSTLTTTEKNVVFDLFGLRNHSQCSVGEVAKRMKTSAKKVAQIRDEAYNKLRKPEFLHIFECNETDVPTPMLESCKI